MKKQKKQKIEKFDHFKLPPKQLKALKGGDGIITDDIMD